jgi:hypothetical protein
MIDTKTETDAAGITTVTLTEEHGDLTTLQIEIVIDKGGDAWYVYDAISQQKTPIYETPEGWTTDHIVEYVKGMLDIWRVKETK